MQGVHCWKGRQLPAVHHKPRANNPLQLIHIDLWGPARSETAGGARYFLTCVDDCTRKVHLTLLKNKSDAFVATQQYIALVERQQSFKVKTIRSDNGGEFTSNAWKNLDAQP